ncbi:MAG: right-handed parallel beta-helix repeat-containing protein [Planctomycetaceae bacterium]|nr:right-handed parallel beta-helix repeat-containing protein [Planctomycetaceae bacterium]
MRLTALAFLVFATSAPLFAQSLGDLPAPRLLQGSPRPVDRSRRPDSNVVPASSIEEAKPSNEPVPPPNGWRPTGLGPLVVPPQPANPPREPAELSELDAMPIVTAQSPPAAPVQTPFEYLAPSIPEPAPIQAVQDVVPPAPPVPSSMKKPREKTGPPAPPPPMEPPSVSAAAESPYMPTPPGSGEPAAPFSYANPPWLDGLACDGPGCDGFNEWGYDSRTAFDPSLWDDHGMFLPFINFQFKPGDARVLTDGRAFLPLFQDEGSLLFADIRGQIDDRSAAEGNWGLGYRTYTPTEWIFGFYGYYDLLHSRFGNNFNQGTVGVELMSLNWDFRVNGYFAETSTKAAGANVSARTGNIVVSNLGEKAYSGMDFETGYRLKAWGENDRVELRWFVGGYYFDAGGAGYKAMVGPRTRLELRMYDLDLFGFQSRLEGGAEFSHDRVRDEQVFGFVRLRVPLGGPRRDRLNPLRRRMLDLPVRDMDVVSNRQVSSTDRAMDSRGNYLDRLVQVNAEDNFLSSIYQAGENSLVVMDGDKGAFYLSPYSTINLQNGQALVGGGTQLTVYGEHSGQAAVLTLPGSRPDILHGSDSPSIPYLYPLDYVTTNQATLWVGETPTINLADNSRVESINIVGGSIGVNANNVTNVQVKDVSVRHVSAEGIKLNNVQHAIVDSVRVSDTGSAGMLVLNGQNVSIRDSQIERATAYGMNISNSKDVQVSGTTVRDIRTDYFRLYPLQTLQAEVAYPVLQPIVIWEPIVYPSPVGIRSGASENVSLTGNTIDAQIGIQLTHTTEQTVVSDNDITFGHKGIAVGGPLAGTLEIGNNTFTSRDSNISNTGIDVVISGQLGQDIRIHDNVFQELGYRGIYVYDNSLAADGLATKIDISRNRFEYAQLGRGDLWSRVDAIQVKSSGLMQVQIDSNTVLVDALAGQYAELGSLVSTWGGGHVTLDLTNNNIPIETFDLIEAGNGRIDVSRSSNNTFDITPLD